MKISYGITCCNEIEEIKQLLSYLTQHKRPTDEVVVLLDKPKASKELELYLEEQARVGTIILVYSNFEGNFANWKNELNSHCIGDFIFQIDADEIPDPGLIETIPFLLENNPEIEMYYVPRINTVSGITQEHIQKWGWRYEDGRVNWPDYQSRIYKNTSDIKWRNAVHEVIEGYTKFGVIPAQDELSLIHPKTIERQEKQNAYYDKL